MISSSYAHVSLPLNSSLIDWLAGDILGQDPGKRDFSQKAVVFPGQRPAFYLRRKIGRLLGGPYHPPQIFDIDSFMGYVADMVPGRSSRRMASQVELLHLIYVTTKGMREDEPSLPMPAMTSSFEVFFFWGLRLLDLFDKFGTELVSPDQIRQAVPSALADAGITEETRGLWPILPGLYSRWLEVLDRESLWSRGERYRTAAGYIDGMEWSFSQIYLAGFAALTRAEERVFSGLTRLGIARVVVQDGPLPCGTDTAKKGPIERLKSVCHGTWRQEESAEPFTTMPSLHLHQCLDLHSQIQMAREVLSQADSQEEVRPDLQAIVLPRPEPLVPILTWLLEDVAVPYNISMGYPLERTPPAQLLDSVFEAQEGRVGDRYYLPQYLDVLRHPYIKNLQLLHRPPGPDQPTDTSIRPLVYLLEDWLAKEKRNFARLEEAEFSLKEDSYASHALVQIHQMCFKAFEGLSHVGEIAKALKGLLEWTAEHGTAGHYPLSTEFMAALIGLLEGLEIGPVSLETASISGLRLLFGHLVRQTRIPFRGIPLEGYQVLGFLETRCLRFQRVMIFDCNEGMLPPEIRPEPILPPGLWRCIGLPDKRQAVEITRYYFHRLLAGAREIHLFYSEDKGQVRSRFVEELIWDAEKRAGHRKVIPISGPIAVPRPEVFQSYPIKKGPQVLEFLSSFTFSATSLDVYLSCPFRFYAKYILNLDIPETIGEDEVDPIRVGTLVHDILREFYLPYINREIRLSADSKEVLIDKSDTALEELFGPREGWSGTVRLFREVLLYRLSNFLRLEREYAQGRMLMGLEVPCKWGLCLENGQKFYIKGRLDRVEIDTKGIVWVIDYKTGSKIKIPKNITTALDRKAIRQGIVSFQLPLYLLLCDRHYGLGSRWSKMNAALYGLRYLTESSDLDVLQHVLFLDKDRPAEIIKGYYIPALKAIVHEILDPLVPIIPDPSDPSYCGSCPYFRRLCRE
ncbi:MAG: hypothetical protein GWP10_03740 [Nitrospiraceae bacterium]|nr:hypothetical protein [Nitrospiraceae bacterium]